MNPDYRKAASKAIETIVTFSVSPKNADPLDILNKLPNVLTIPYKTDTDPLFYGDNQDAFTLVNKSEGKLQFIILYNQNLSCVKLRAALARELAHVILEHDGNSPEDVWEEEASCFAHHFICPLPLLPPFYSEAKHIYFRPKRHNLSWEMKGMQTFDSIGHMKLYIATEQNNLNRFVGSSTRYEIDDVLLQKPIEYDKVTGWRNCHDIVLAGKTIGYCGE